jgi:outer membrane protein OmpA-like peptidoglycan-associated protein
LSVRESDTEIQVQLGSGVLFDTGKFELKPAVTSTPEGRQKNRRVEVRVQK